MEARTLLGYTQVPAAAAHGPAAIDMAIGNERPDPANMPAAAWAWPALDKGSGPRGHLDFSGRRSMTAFRIKALLRKQRWSATIRR